MTEAAAAVVQDAPRSPPVTDPAGLPGSAAIAQDAQTRAAEQRLLQETQREIRELARRDREVRTHEQAHASVGGRYASAPRYEFTRGPNGVSYAVSGSVQIDVSPVPGDPEATLQKMDTVRRAALAVAQPSAADRAVARQASAQAVEARAELARERTEATRAGDEEDRALVASRTDEAEGAAGAPAPPPKRFGDTGGAFVDIRV
ncbi:MAG: putative metalloprotease CJM1_0395 family protein [Pseudomonadota bacterium]